MRKTNALLIATRRFAKEDWRSWWHLWSTLAILIGLLGATCLATPWFFRMLLSGVAGLTLVLMFVIYHDYQHGAILRGSRLADCIMLAYGLYTLNPPTIWNRSHRHHHKHNAKVIGSDIGTFPLLTTDVYAKASRLQRFHYALVRHPLTILFGYVTVFFYGMCLNPLIANPRQNSHCAIAIIFHVAMVVLLAVFAPDMLLFTFLLPCMVASTVGSYLFYAQHNFPDMKLQERGEWDYVFAALNSSSYIAMSPIMHWFTGNIGYHHVHHLNARIPFYRLPEAMAAIAELQSPGTTSLWPRDIYRCLRLKLWCPKSKCMVNFAGR